ncbi:hypothetical protein L7F22_047167 [Adiantum nelumboides]|nr:hypothetical protein [Adiantum nelumboides]
MEPPYRPGDYGFEDQEGYRHSPFHHRPPPPPPPFGEDEFGEQRRGDEDGGFPRRHTHFEEERFGKEDGEEGSYGRRREDPNRERFGREDDYETGQPLEGRPHFPPMGFHRTQHEDAPPPSDDVGYPQYAATSHSPPHSGSFHGQHPSGDFGTADPADPVPVKEVLPEGEASLTSQMDSLSLDLPQGRLVRIFCKENSGYNLAVAHNSLSMQDSNTEDESQQWIKDASHGLRIKDSYGYPAFSLVNKKTKKVLKHANEQGQQVLLVDYQADLKNDNILWTESQDFGEGFKTIRRSSTVENFPPLDWLSYCSHQQACGVLVCLRMRVRLCILFLFCQ